ncbi:Ankyrin repeats (3 copies) [Phytophthora infestans]|uniref:Ankyrin repeats (3 copies) n=1 Tax=Phytophthora infestans TaxID=4787 RepID=A0A833TBG4_PHYIN|nr:Ankyrin repeats (3 copies) [Phytophthora infestans]
MVANKLEMPLSPSPEMREVRAAWLTACSTSDVDTMRRLSKQFPQWLHLQRVPYRFHLCQRVGMSDPQISAYNPIDLSELTQLQSRICHWDGFHLRTLGASALHTAAWRGDVAVIEFLLESGQHPDTGYEGGMTAMMVPILRLSLMTTRCVFRDRQVVQRNLVVDCHEEEDGQLKKVVAVLELLLRFGANVDAQSKDGKTALHCCTTDESYPVAKLLLDADANVDAQDENGKTPLHYCVQEGGLAVTNLLLGRGASVDVADARGITPIQLMLQRSDLNILQLLLNHHQCVVTPQRQHFASSLLLQAVDAQVEAVVLFIVDEGYAPVTVRNEKGETAMHRAILCRSPSVMELLSDLDKDGDTLTTVTTDGKTAAHYAAAYGSAREVETLLLCLSRVFGDLKEMEQRNVTNPLNFADGSGMTSLYIAGTTVSLPGRGSNSDSFRDDRDAKVGLLLDHGGQLFPYGFLARELWRPGLSLDRLMLAVEVQRCLEIWLENDDACREAFEDEMSDPVEGEMSSKQTFVDLCMQWIACAACLGPARTLVAVVTSAGYAHEVLPLLLHLPLRRPRVPCTVTWVTDVWYSYRLGVAASAALGAE